MHRNMTFQGIKVIFFWRGAQLSPQTPFPRAGGDPSSHLTPLGAYGSSILVPLALPPLKNPIETRSSTAVASTQLPLLSLFYAHEIFAAK